MFYIKGTHRNFRNVVWLECVPGMIGVAVRPCNTALRAEAFGMDNVEIIRRIHVVNYPDYEWLPVPADTDAIIPANMRKVINV